MGRKIKVEEDQKERIRTQARHYATLRKSERDTESARKEASGPLKDAMEEAKLTQVTIPDFSDEEKATIRVKERDNSEIDAGKLKKAIGAKAFNKLTTPSLDEAKVEAAIKLGELDANTVSQCMTESKTTYLEVRFTRRKKV